MTDLLEQLQVEEMRLRIKPGKYYKLRANHLYRVLDLCESTPELKIVMDTRFFCHYLRHVAGLLTREIRLVYRLTNMNMACVMDLANLRRILSLLNEEIVSTVVSARPVTTVKTKHRRGFRIWLQRWCNNHRDLVNTLPLTVFLVLILIIMIITELK